MGCIFLLLCMPGNFLLDVNSHEFFLFGCWIFVCLFSITLFWLEDEVTLCPLRCHQWWGIRRSISGHWHVLPDGSKWNGLGWSSKMLRVHSPVLESGLLPLSDSIINIVLFIFIFFALKKEINLNYWSSPDLELLFSTKCVLLPFFFILLFIYSTKCPVLFLCT